jgi:broad specificity phosphatase PhoE
MPKRLILVRHGESLGNVDQTVYRYRPDHALPLTDKGTEQAIELGRRLRDIVPVGESVSFFVSPYRRSQETMQAASHAFATTAGELQVREDPRIREQDFGNFQNPGEMKKFMKERGVFGTFYYRFPSGESAADVYDRVSSFLESLYRHFEGPSCADNIIIVAHSICVNVFLARWEKMPIAEYEDSRLRLGNCDFVVLERVFDKERNERRLNFAYLVRDGERTTDRVRVPQLDE